MPKETRPIVVVGSINMDLVATAEKIPSAGETVLGSCFEMHPGGKGANQAVAVARLGYPVQMIGKLGSDSFGKQLLDHLQSSGVGLTGTECVEDASGTAMILVAPRGENCIVVNSGANAHVTPEYVESHLHLIRNAGLVLTQLEIPIETVEYLAEACFRESVPLILDPAPAQTLPPQLLKRIHWFTPNETEAAFYVRSDMDGLANGVPGLTARLLLEQGPAGVILKMGSRGAYLAGDGLEQQLNAIAVEATDTTGAGDALNGAFAVGLMSGKTPVESLRFAVAAASVSVTRSGAQAAMPTFTEVTRMLHGRS
ncbi:MAG TPA: ribokinase [Acidobacteriaceae bacterium]|jgi:ribokinase|nr:ribokinase [Acidobacteriaceae bacterium]